MSAIRLAGHDVLSARLALPLFGVGSLEAELDLDEDTAPPTGTVGLTFEDENGDVLTYRVTILDVLAAGDVGRETAGRHRVFAVQGAGALRVVRNWSDYDQCAPRLIAADMLTGESLDIGSLDAYPPLRRWSPPASTGRAALTRLAELLGVAWRVLPDGGVTVAPDTWPPYGGAVPLYTAEPDAHGLCELALDVPDLRPGMTIPPPSGVGLARRVAEVVYTVTGFTFRVSVRLQALAAPGGGETRDAFRAAVQSVLPPSRLLVPHFATVVVQEGDGSLSLRLDGEAPPRLTLSGVPVYLGLPGRRVKVPGGTQVLVEFVGGSESTPIVRNFVMGSPLTEETIDGGTVPLAKRGDTVDCGFFTIGPGPIYALAPAPAGTPGAVQVTGTITSGTVGGGKVKG